MSRPLLGDDGSYPSPSFSKHVLEPMKVGMTMIASARYESYPGDPRRDEMVHRLSAWVLAEKLADDTYSDEVRTPATTWQMFKSRHILSWWWPAWAAARWPVRHETHRLEVRVERFLQYPEANLRLPELGRPVIFERPSQKAWTL